MTVRAKSIAVAGVLGLVVAVPVAWRHVSSEPPTAAMPPAPTGAPEARGVKVEHEFVSLPLVPLEVERPTGTPFRAVQPARRPFTEPRTLAAKTKRALLGDGRHRPEPFPRAR